MRVRTLLELDDFLSASKVRRNHELIWFRHQLSPNVKLLQWVTRSAIVLAYAHWEGFVKDAATAYVEYVTYKTRRLSDLSLHFQALACRQELLFAQPATKKILPHIAVARRMIDEIGTACQINPNLAIDTGSNLDAEVFENICNCIGVDYAIDWSTRGKLIDDLFSTRCAIAHGELYVPERKVALEHVEFVTQAIEDFSTSIGNAASMQLYLRNPGPHP